MKLDKEKSFFFGCKIDSKMREALALARPGDRKYFEHTGDSTEFLQIVSTGEENWIGKVLKGGMSVTAIDDIQRNIISILRRISPTIRTKPSAIKIYLAEDNGGVAEVSKEEVVDSSSSSGPYIDF